MASLNLDSPKNIINFNDTLNAIIHSIKNSNISKSFYNKFYKFWEQFDNELSIYDYSNILKEYKKQSKIIDYRGSYGYYSLFGFTRYVKDIKILYRASEQKHFIIKDLLKLEDILSKNKYILIMKLSNNVFFYMESMQGPNSYNYRSNYFFTIDHISYLLSNSNIIFNKKDVFKYLDRHSPHIDIGPIQNALQTVFTAQNPEKPKDEISKMVYETLRYNIKESKDYFYDNKTIWTECEDLK